MEVEKAVGLHWTQQIRIVLVRVVSVWIWRARTFQLWPRKKKQRLRQNSFRPAGTVIKWRKLWATTNHFLDGGDRQQPLTVRGAKEKWERSDWRERDRNTRRRHSRKSVESCLATALLSVGANPCDRTDKEEYIISQSHVRRVDDGNATSFGK